MSDPELDTFTFNILLFVAIKPREQLSMFGVVPTLEQLQSLGLVSMTPGYPGMPESNIWTVTWAGIQYIQDWKENTGDNNHRLYGPSSSIPQ